MFHLDSPYFPSKVIIIDRSLSTFQIGIYHIEDRIETDIIGEWAFIRNSRIRNNFRLNKIQYVSNTTNSKKQMISICNMVCLNCEYISE